MNQSQLKRVPWVEELAFHQIRLRTHQAQMARHLGHARSTGQQAQRDFGHAELNFVVVHGNAVMADQRRLPTAA